MNILIVGAAGMLGRKLVGALISREAVRSRPVESLTLADIVEPERPDFAGKVETVAADLSATVGDQIEALRRVAGDRAARLIRREPNPAIATIIAGWPRSFDARRAEALGFRAEKSFDEIIRVHIEDELAGAPTA